MKSQKKAMVEAVVDKLLPHFGGLPAEKAAKMLKSIEKAAGDLAKKFEKIKEQADEKAADKAEKAVKKAEKKAEKIEKEKKKEERVIAKAKKIAMLTGESATAVAAAETAKPAKGKPGPKHGPKAKAKPGPKAKAQPAAKKTRAPRKPKPAADGPEVVFVTSDEAPF
jgi:hypothetical protein